jgi:hypothetical protein
MRKLSTNPHYLGLVVVSFLLAVFALPWQLSKIITGSTWQNPTDFSKSIQEGLRFDLLASYPHPGTGASALADETRFWFWFHLTKSLLSLGLFFAVLNCLRLLRNLRTIEFKKHLKFLYLSSQLLLSWVMVFAFILVISNIQGTFAPLSSAFSFLPANRSDQTFMKEIEYLRSSLGSNNPTALASSIAHDFSTYHAVIAVIFFVTCIFLMRLVARSALRRNYYLGLTYGTFLLGSVLLAIANIGTAIQPAPALIGFLEGF